MFIQPFCKSNSLKNDSLLTQTLEKYRSNVSRFDPLIPIRKRMQCEPYELSSDPWFLNN